MKGIESCIYVQREICERPSIILMDKNLFKNIFLRESYLKVLVNQDFKETGLSKSYYYYILDKLKKSNLINENNKLNFTIVVAYKLDDKDFSIKFEPILVFLSIKRKILYIFDIRKKCFLDEEILKELGKDGKGKKEYSCRNIIENIYKIVSEHIIDKGVIYVQ
ncbi:hypothetical protein DFR86_11265 [Acidianus sulfidivorans JP7]|uniref:Uncharacterized protein n=1 Tax=Acidianus sulfidivorans JP7 TaxID=619593 RepID=A0A2U9IPZ5_9CREN|nr:hypothetical protein [Acidianus sulfidivorans]AWR98056.1 hypothetical protein DFR86_11265 [Acidianus sulfidivorans JP7]